MKNRIKFAALALSLSLLVPTLPPLAAATEEAESRSVADYSGKGAVVAVIDTGFDVSHAVFSVAPAAGKLTADAVTEAVGEGYYVSEKIPYARDYADGDADVSGTSHVGTAAASLAAGHYIGAGDTANEDGTVTHESDYLGAAPDAQLLLLKAAPDGKASVTPEAAAAAIRDAVKLGADVIVLRLSSVTLTKELKTALAEAEAAGVPTLTGAGESTKQQGVTLPVTYTDRSTLADYAGTPGLTLVGSAADPYADAVAVTLTEEGKKDVTIQYSDSCEDYFDAPFAALMGGTTLPFRLIPNYGSAADYAGIDCTGAVAVVQRGVITFLEKAKAAAAAGAVAMLVIDTEAGGASRMALEGAPIPAVLLPSESLSHFTDAADSARIVFPAAEDGVSVISAVGVDRAFTSTVAFLSRGESLPAAIPAAQTADTEVESDTEDAETDAPRYANVSGTYYAAASAAGYVARAAEFCRAAGLATSDALAYTAATAKPSLAPDGGMLLSPRQAGCGVVSGEGTYPDVLLTDADGGSVSVTGVSRYTTVRVEICLTNPGDTPRRYTLRAHFFTDGYEIGEDGVAYLTGKSTPLPGVDVYIGDSSINIAADSGEGAAVTVGANRTLKLSLRIRLPEDVRQELAKTYWNGFYIDGVLSFTEEGSETPVLLHPLTGFWGDYSDAPLADTSVYDGETAVFAPATLHTYRLDENGATMELGRVNPYISGTPYSMEYNTVNPEHLRYGWVELHLYALRDIDSVTVTFYDSDRRVVFSNSVGSVEKYLRAGAAVIPLWDFIATDNREYIFPDGEYSCEIRLSADFGAAGDAVQFLGFTFTVDTARPTVSDVTAWQEDGRTYLRFTAEDETALWTASAYDTVYSFPRVGDEADIAGNSAASLTYDITQYDAMDPLYIEITDRAGNYRVYRYSAAAVESLLAASAEAEEETETESETESDTGAATEGGAAA